MRKHRYTGWYMKILSYIMAALMMFMQPCSVLASETDLAGAELSAADIEQTTGEELQTADDTASVKYITAFEPLAEEDTYFPCMYKPMSEELAGVFPEMLLVWLEGEAAPVEIPVTWECEDDYDTTMQPYYFFYPKWDETQYIIAEAVKDSIEIPIITIEVPTEGGSVKNPEEAKLSLQDIIQEKAVLASVYLCDTYEIKTGPSSDDETIYTVGSGQSVQITDVEADEYGIVWYQVLLYRNGTAYTGYIEKDYLATSDEDFTEWEETYLDFSAVPMTMALTEGYPDIDQFPASYQNALYALKEKHPDWTFVRMDTGIDWNTAIANELGDKSWISSSRSGSWQNGSTKQKGWSYASEGILKYYMDPRNFLVEPYIFQFEQLIYNSSYHTTDAVQEILNGSFMAAMIPDDGQTYAQAFTTIGQEIGVSPFHLASRVLQEQGAKGGSALISGVYPGCEGYYNFFNIGAYGIDNATVIANGLKRAKTEGWNTRYASLRGGAGIIGNQYILCDQDTLYLEKFNVSGGKYANYTHQYMQNIEAPYSESSSIYKAYAKAGVLERKFVFKIPVYENMPASACTQPEKTDALTLDKTVISSLEVDKSVTLVPYVNGSKVDHVNDMTFTSSNPAVAVVNAQGKVTAVSPGNATISCTRSGANLASCTVTVVKGNPVVSTPVLSPVTYREGLKLSEVVLPDGWVWENGNTVIAVGTLSYAAVYTPSDTTKYNAITKNISFTVTKAIPTCQVPTGLEVKSGAKLGSTVLPTGFSWESDVETVLTNTGEYTFYVSYNPDENNYYPVNHIPVIVQVKETVLEEPSGGSGNTGGSESGIGTGTSGGNGGIGIGTGNGNTGTGGGNTGGSGSGTEGGNTSGGTSGGGNVGGTGNGGGTGSGSGSGTSGSGNGNGGEIGTGSDGNGASGSAVGGSTSSGNVSTGNTSTGSTLTGGTQQPSSSGSTAAGGTQPPSSSGSAAAGNTTIGSTQPPSSSGGMTANGTGSQTENSLYGNQTSESTPGGSESSGNPESGHESSENTADENAASGSASGGSAPVENTQSDPPAVTVPDGNTPSPGATSAATSAGTSSSAEANSGAQINMADGNGADNIAGMGENGSSTEGGTEEAVSSEEVNYYRPAVTIPMEDTTILTPEKMQMAKEQNFDLLLDMGNAVTWSIDVDSIDENAMTEVDMGVTLGTENVPQELISTILNGNKYLEVTLAHQGTFGFEPVMNIALGKEYSGQYANLFYYDSEKESLEFICSAIIGPDGVASLRFEHASCYLIIVSGQSMSGVSFDDDSVNPLTRWIIIGVFVCMLLVVIGYGIFFFLKKKREEEGEENDEEEEEDEPEEDMEYEELDDEEDMEYEDIEYEESDDEEDAEYGEPDDDDWIEDEDWHEPESNKKFSIGAGGVIDSREKNDWLEEEEENMEDDWIEDDEWVE